MLLKKRLMLILAVAVFMVMTAAASAVPAFALNPQPIPPGVHGYSSLEDHNVSDPGIT
jgi:hypothetical protein